ncbi:hypothetical protein D3C84_889450 [compost metagenome]
MQARQRQAGLAGAQQVGKQVVITEPAPVFVQRYQEHLVGLQVTEDLGAVMAFTQGVAEFCAKALLAGGVVEKALHFGRQYLDDFFEQVIANQPFAAMQRLRQGAVGARLVGGQQPEAQTGDPAIAALDQVVQRLPA